jgi:hypothetical protein
MARSFSVVTNTNTFEAWLDRTNEMVTEFANVVTVAGDAPDGNAVVNGTISAQTFYATSDISGGEVGSPANLVFSSAVEVQNTFDVDNESQFNGNVVFAANVTLAGANNYLGAIANLYILASPAGVQDYLAVNSSLQHRGCPRLLRSPDLPIRLLQQQPQPSLLPGCLACGWHLVHRPGR